MLDTTRISGDDRKKYEKVIDEFDKYFKVKKNMIYERAQFNQCSQLLDESADHFITEIHKLADNWNPDCLQPYYTIWPVLF